MEEAVSGTVYRCSSCGGSVRYDIESHVLICESCSRHMSLEEINRKLPEPSGAMDAVEYRCPQCGATLYTTRTGAAAFCSFCGADVLLTERMTRTRRPDKIVPFKITRKKCEEIYRERLKESKFTPRDLLEQPVGDRFRPVYVPFYSYRYAYGGENTVTGTKTWSDSSYNYSDEYECVVEGTASGEGVYECASSAMEPDTADELQLKASAPVPFSPAYLCGFYAEMPDIQARSNHRGLYSAIKSKYTQKIASKAGMTYATGNLPAESEREVSLVMLPVWLLASRQGERVLYTAINGDSGQIVCDTPVDRKTLGRMSLRWGLIFAAVFFLLSQLLILRARLVTGLCAVAACAVQYLVNRTAWWRKERELRKNVRGPESDADVRPVFSMSEIGLPGIAYLFILGTVAMFSFILCNMMIDMKKSGFGWCVFFFTGAAYIIVLLFMNHGAWKKKELRFPGTDSWFLLRFLPMLAGAMAACFFGALIFRNENELIAGLVGDGGFLAPVLCVCALAGNIYTDGWDDRKNFLLWMAQMALAGAALIMMLAGYGADYLYYGITAVIMGLSAVSMERLNSSFEEFVTRPVPFFGKEESVQ